MNTLTAGAPQPARRRSKMGAWALVLSLSPFLVLAIWVSLSSFFGDQDPSEVIGPLAAVISVLGIFYFVGPFAGIAMGFGAFRTAMTGRANRSMALAAIVIGCATLALYVLFFVVLVIGIVQPSF